MIIISIFGIIFGVTLIVLAFADFNSYGTTTLFALFGGIVLFLSITYYFTYDTPQAIDVYRGKTTLQITYKDNIPIDTIVVFK